MSARAPVRVQEAADSLAKASTPEPFSTSRTSNWVARGGGLPAYIQHIAHDLVEKRGKSESNAIQMAIGIVKRWARGGGNVDSTTRAAAAKAVAEWEALKAKNAARGASKVAEASIADEMAVRDAALSRIAVCEQLLGGTDGLIGVLAEDALQEAAGFKPTLKRTASANSEIERHEVHEDGQQVGMIAQRPKFNGGSRWHAHAVNGERITDYEGATSRQGALDALQKHLEDAPGRLSQVGDKHLVATVGSYGPTTYKSYPSSSSARYAAGMPEKPCGPEKASQVHALGEVLRFDLMTVSGLDIPPLRRVQEARRDDPFDLVAEAFRADELRDFRGRWREADATFGGEQLEASG